MTEAAASVTSPAEGPLVSVVMPTHNRETMVRRAIGSVLGQTYRNLELIVVDDASEDGTADVVASYNSPHVRYFRHEENRGASAARNTGIERSRGEYIAFLDDDDEWLPTKLELQVPILDAASAEVAMVYCWMDYFDGQGQLVGETHPRLRGKVFGQMLDRPRIGGCPTLLVRREVFQQVGGFDEELPRGNDGDFMRRVCLRYAVDLVPAVLVRVHVDHGRQRITRFDEQGIRNAIKGHKAKLTKFRDELPKYPRQTAAIYTSIGHHHSQLGEWKEAVVSYLKALKTAPLSIDVYRSVLRSVKELLTRTSHR